MHAARKPPTAKFRFLLAVFGLGFMVCIFANNVYPPVEQTYVWGSLAFIWLGGLLSLFRAQKTDDGFFLHLALVLLSTVAGVALYANALADHAPPIARPTTVVKRFWGKSGYKLRVIAWSSGGTISIPVKSNCYWTMTPGTPATVWEKPGALGIAWVSGIDGCSQ